MAVISRGLEGWRLECLAEIESVGGNFLRCGAAEPVLETRRAEARVVAGGEALIVHCVPK